MPDISPTSSQPASQDGSVIKISWTLSGTDAGQPVQFAEWADRGVQFTGQFDGGSIVFEGSNDGGQNWYPLTDPHGVPILARRGALIGVSEIAELARPRATTPVQSVTVSLIARRPSRN